jgi:hypothetical protein
VTRRLRGLFIITRALLPFIVVAALVFATWVMARAVINSTLEYGDQMAQELEAVATALDEANDGLEAIGGFVIATATAADNLVGRVAEIPNAINVPLPTVEIPDFRIPVINQTIRLPDFDLGDGLLNIPIPGIAPVQALAAELVEAGQTVSDPILKAAALADVPPHLEQAAEETAVYAGSVRDTMMDWFIVMLVVLIAAAGIWAIAALRPITSELSRGWAMLRGRPSAERSLGSLEQRVRDLERASNQ